MAASPGPERPSFRRQLESRRRRPRAAHHSLRSRGPRQTVDRHFGGRCLRHRRRRQNLGAPQPPVQPWGLCGPPPSGRAGRWRDRPLRPQHDARAGQRRPHLPAEPSRRLAFRRRRPQLGRHHGRPAVHVRLSDLRASARPRHDLDPSAQWRHRRPFPARRLCRRLAFTRRRTIWQALRDGLPQQACYFTVLRQAMARDAGDPAGVYFGTNSGSVFASTDEGDSWREVARHLPTVLSVEVMARQ